MFLKQYDALARQFYNVWNYTFTKSSAFKYASYGFNVTKVYFPKVSYQSSFEPEYTKPSIKYNYLIVSAIVGLTIVATKAKVNSYYN
jgi:hypothetical protein